MEQPGTSVGSNEHWTNVDHYNNQYEPQLEECDACHGSGKLDGGVCPECEGKGRYEAFDA